MNTGGEAAELGNKGNKSEDLGDDMGAHGKSAEAAEAKVRVLGPPPSQKMVAEHNRTHYPFRSWCPVCVGAKAVDPGHYVMGSRDAEESKIRHEVSLDYCFMRDKAGAESATVLVGKDRRSGLHVGHVVPCKGSAVEWVVEQTCRDLKKMGYYGLVTLKGDQEHAIQDLLRADFAGDGPSGRQPRQWAR